MILLINSSTRLAVLSIPVWIGVLFLMYQNIKESRKTEIPTETEEDVEEA